MGAHLQLVSAAAQSVEHHELRVFTASFQEHLAKLNHAERELRHLGLQVAWSRIAKPVLEIRIIRDKQVSISSLLDRMGPRSFRKDKGCTIVCGEFEAVTVSWEEPA